MLRLEQIFFFVQCLFLLGHFAGVLEGIKMSLRCFLFGHSWHLNHIDPEGLHHLLCSHCSKILKCNSNAVCKMTKNHDWRPCSAQHYDLHSFLSNSVKDVKTRRSWKCHICQAVKQDIDNEMLSGYWFVTNEEFISEQEAVKRGFKVADKDKI